MEDESRVETLRLRVSEERNSRAFVLLAEEDRRLGRLDEAMQTLKAGLEEQPDFVAASVALGRCQLEAGLPSDSVETLEQVVAADQTQMVAYKLLIGSHLENGDDRAARAAFENYRDLNPQDPDLGEIEATLGSTVVEDVGEPAPQPESVFALLPRLPPAAGLVGLEPRELHRPLAASVGPVTPTVTTVPLADLYLEQGHLSEAEDIFRRVAEDDEQNEAARAGLETIARRRATAAESLPQSLTEPFDPPVPRARETLGEDESPERKRALFLRSYAERLAVLRKNRDAAA